MTVGRLAPALGLALASSSVLAGACLSAWPLGGPWACSADQTCAQGYTCDDGVCCKPGGQPACPTLPAPNGNCETGEAKVWFEDRDGDGDGNARVSRVLCRAPLTGGWVLSGTDCDDADLSINLAARETCNGKDDNCDGVIDEGLPGLRPFQRDSDGDGYGEAGTDAYACAAPPGMVELPGDCAPFDPSKFPGGVELCNGLDDDCDGTPDSLETAFGDTGGAWPCLTGRPGICSDGAFACVPQGGGVARQCVSSSTMRRETCNQVDDDCDGMTDEQPSCLGPVSLVGVAGATYSAKRITSTSSINVACQRSTAGVAEPVSANGAVWNGVSPGFHVWAVEVPAGSAWDLSAPNAKLRLTFSASIPSSALAGGAWGNRSLDHPANPVIYVCGDTDGEVIRYVSAAANDLSGNEMSFSSVLMLNNLAGDWVTGRGSGFDTSRVRRLEVMLWNQAGNFTVTFDGASGFFQ
ncbi:MAG: putative metal-binding motif-containing protein [Myxococcales bacterium]|nr:putative metal-binding motif-containing protein [Myxococcales bacterium]